jgi:hypothetical protein
VLRPAGCAALAFTVCLKPQRSPMHCMIPRTQKTSPGRSQNIAELPQCAADFS